MQHSKVYMHAEVRQSEKRTRQDHSALAEDDVKGLANDTAGVASNVQLSHMDYPSFRKVGLDLHTRTPAGKGQN